MNRLLSIALLIPFLSACSSATRQPVDTRLQQQASRITIIRDNWGIPHIYGKTDADVVFGTMYAQCEESFERVERAYIEKLGRLSELEGPDYLLQDVKMRLLYDTATALADYQHSPQWLKQLLQAFSDGIHYYLQTHPDTKPQLLQHFEPWYPLLQTDGAFIATQTGGLTTQDLQNLYGKNFSGNPVAEPSMPAGSNGFALAPARTANGNTLLYINPHVSFFFRTEMHLVSEEGLNAYGAVTWGQFFVFQGFNEHCGWMHTSSAADAADLYAEQVTKKGSDYVYAYEGAERKVTARQINLCYKSSGQLIHQPLNTYATHHGSIVGLRSGKWLSLKAKNHSLEGLIQSWQRMKAINLKTFTETLNLRANPSTNTLYADDAGNIAYWHGNFLPKRAASLNTFAPLDGSVAATEWQGIHTLNELVHYLNPSSGFLQNCNSSPFSAAGKNRLASKNFPDYMAPEGENFRSLYALKCLQQSKAWSLDSLTALGYDRYLSIFDTLLPPLLQDLGATTKLSSDLLAAADTLRRWDRRSATVSVATSLAVFWAYALLGQQKPDAPTNVDDVQTASWHIHHTTPAERVQLLSGILAGLQQVYGTWRVPWGDINRFQRWNGMSPSFDGHAGSLPSPLASASLGSLPSFEAHWQEGKQYGYAGNSFVAVVEFGKRVRAFAVSTGGQSFDASSRHFNDQSELFLNGQLRPVWFYLDEVEAHAAEKYQPGADR
jgi:acyl-homoserine-lactone acylase